LKKTIQLAFFLISALCNGQIVEEGVNSKDIREIILNYSDHHVAKFKITYKVKFNDRKYIRKQTLYFSIKNDSFLTQKYKRFAEDFNFVIRNKQIIYISNKGEAELKPNKYFTIKQDSVNVSFEKTFRIDQQDTLPYYLKQVTYDSLKRITEHIDWNYDEPRYCHKWNYYYNADTITKDYFKNDSINWYIVSRELLTSTLTNDIGPKLYRTTLTENSYGTSYFLNGEFTTSKYKNIKVTNYNKEELIQSIIREENEYPLSDNRLKNSKRIIVLTAQRQGK
jgi:hypothetical protein